MTTEEQRVTTLRYKQLVKQLEGALAGWRGALYGLEGEAGDYGEVYEQYTDSKQQYDAAQEKFADLRAALGLEEVDT